MARSSSGKSGLANDPEAEAAASMTSAPPADLANITVAASNAGSTAKARRYVLRLAQLPQTRRFSGRNRFDRRRSEMGHANQSGLRTLVPHVP